MEGIVSCLDPDEVFVAYVENMIDEEKQERNDYDFSWWYLNQTEIIFRIFEEPRRGMDHEERSVCDEFIIKVPRVIETEIWTQIKLIENEIYELIIFEDKRIIPVSEGYEDIMRKLNENFGAGVLDQSQFENSVRVLKGLRLKQIL